MKNIALAAIGVTVLALSACAPAYYDRYDRYGYYGRDGYYGRGYYDRSYYDRGYYDRDRDRDNDGVPNDTDRRPYNPYRY